MNPDYAKIVKALADAVKELNVPCETPSESSAAEPLAAAAAAAAEHGSTYQKKGRTTTLGQSAGLGAAEALWEFLYGNAPPAVPPQQPNAVPPQQPNAPAQPNKKNAKKLSEAASAALSAAG